MYPHEASHEYKCYIFIWIPLVNHSIYDLACSRLHCPTHEMKITKQCLLTQFTFIFTDKYLTCDGGGILGDRSYCRFGELTFFIEGFFFLTLATQSLQNSFTIVHHHVKPCSIWLLQVHLFLWLSCSAKGACPKCAPARTRPSNWSSHSWSVGRSLALSTFGLQIL